MTKAFSHSRAIGYALLAFTIWALGDSFTKLSGQTRLPAAKIIVVSSLFCALTIFGVSAARGRIAQLKPKRWKLEIVRGLFYVALSFVNVFSFTHFPLTTVYVVLFLCPVFVALFAALFLREPLSWPQSLAILAGFGGVLLALHPSQEDFGNSFVMTSAVLILFPVLAALNTVFTRFLSRTEHGESMALFPTIARTLIILPFFVHQFQPITNEQMWYLAGMGIVGALGLLLMMDAIKYAPAALLWPFQYSQLVSGALLGFLIWHEVPSWPLVAGSAVIIASGLYIAHHARRIEARALSVSILR